MFKIYDKAQWHIDAGEDSSVCTCRIIRVLEFLDQKDLLTDEGKEVLEFGIDSSVSLNERMVNERGNQFLEQYYDKVLGMPLEDVMESLGKLYSK